MSGKGYFQFPCEGMDLFCNDSMQLTANSTMKCLLNLTTDFLILFQVYVEKNGNMPVQNQVN